MALEVHSGSKTAKQQFCIKRQTTKMGSNCCRSKLIKKMTKQNDNRSVKSVHYPWGG